MKPQKPIELDGRTGEGGGQLVRLAVALAAVTSQPIRIVNVRGNREGPKGGGLKAQHVSAVKWLVDATNAEVSGLSVGSHTLEFRPGAVPSSLKQRNIKIVPETSAASTMLIFQAVFPFLLFAGNHSNEPVTLEIHGGTNVSFSFSYEYLDQVLLPTLEQRFGVIVERKLKQRGWNTGPSSKGAVWFKFQPVPLGQTLKLLEPWDKPIRAKDLKIKQIDVTILAPQSMHEPMEKALAHNLDALFPDVDIQFVAVEESHHEARMYTLLVARSETGFLWGIDYLNNRAWKKKSKDTLSAEMSRHVCRLLAKELEVRGAVDEYLQDQLVVFQALAEGKTSFHRGEEPADGGAEKEDTPADDMAELESDMGRLQVEKRMRKDKTHEPFGEGSTHTTTARWVASELLPAAQWFNKGSICEGIGLSYSE